MRSLVDWDVGEGEDGGEVDEGGDTVAQLRLRHGAGVERLCLYLDWDIWAIEDGGEVGESADAVTQLLLRHAAGVEGLRDQRRRFRVC